MGFEQGARSPGPRWSLFGWPIFRSNGSDPLLIETNTSSEYWQKGAWLLHTDPAGEGCAAVLAANARAYLIASTQHNGSAGLPRDAGLWRNPRNRHDPMPVVRPLLVALDEWVATGRRPPDSRVPTMSEGTLVAAELLRFPHVPGFAIPLRANEVAPAKDAARAAHPYRALVPAVDVDGNEVADVGRHVKLPPGDSENWPPSEIEEAIDGPEACDKTSAVGGAAEYVTRVAVAAAALADERLLLPEDATRYVSRAVAVSSGWPDAL